MGGDFSLPVKYGYSLIGRNVETGTIGHLMHPHQDECIVDPDDFFIIPEEVPAKRATLAANLETALTAVWDADMIPGQRVSVIGFGLIGSLIARLALDIPDVSLYVVETNPHRAQIAINMGFTIAKSLDPNSQDIAFHCSATESGLQSAIDGVGLEGKVIELSWYGSKPVSLKLGGDFHYLRKKIIASQVSHIPSHMTGQWDFRRRKEAVFELLKDPAYDAHITHELSLGEAAELFNTARTSPLPGLGYCIKY
jgi:threonine dehydrogenase-like Zn-dependent dehydrogenase